MPARTLSERLQYLVDVTDVSAREISDLAGLTHSHVAILLSADRDRVEARTVAALAKVFGVSMDWLYSGLGGAPDIHDIMLALQAARTRHTRLKSTG